jgi:hypothetical protein
MIGDFLQNRTFTSLSYLHIQILGLGHNECSICMMDCFVCSFVL